MFKNLFNPNKDNDQNQLANSQILFASLLVRAARIDNEYSFSEKQQIDKILEKKFSIANIRAMDIRKAGENHESNTLDTVQITREIKRDIPFENRKLLAEDLWSIILADDKRTEEENSFMRTCIKLIGVNDVDSAKARQAVINRTLSENKP